MDTSIKGLVIHGDGYGRKLGFPTLNLDTVVKDTPAGVYAGNVILDGKKYRAGIVINNKERTDAYVIGYSGDAYGKIVEFQLHKFIREFKSFPDEKELITQIRKDLDMC